jgi:hypothetical protein
MVTTVKDFIVLRVVFSQVLTVLEANNTKLNATTNTNRLNNNTNNPGNNGNDDNGAENGQATPLAATTPHNGTRANLIIVTCVPNDALVAICACRSSSTFKHSLSSA